MSAGDDVDSKNTPIIRIGPPILPGRDNQGGNSAVASIRPTPPLLGDQTDLGHPDLRYYSNPDYKRGICLIINQKKFDSSTGQDQRSGTDVDAERCGQLFSSLDFSVTRKDNLSCSEMKATLKNIAAADHFQEECFVCVIMSHGEQDYVYGRDGKILFQDLVFHFKGDQCKTLKGKPKIFIIQACRGTKFDKGITAEAGVDNSKALEKIPVEADFLYAFSTVPGYFSWRNNQNGSWFLQTLCEVFREFGTRYEILELLTVVNRKVGLAFKSCTDQEFTNNMKQQPSFVSMLTRKFYLTSKKKN